VSLEFAVEYACPLRARYAEKHLRGWGRLGNLHARLTTGDTAAPSPDKLRFVEDTGGEIERVEHETEICLTCPACLPQEFAGEGESVGCLGRITYPIEAQFEKFLADRTQLALDTIDHEDQPRLLRILVDAESPFDGEGAKELRRVTTADGLRFFELRIPINLTNEGRKISTDHIFDLLSGFTSPDAETTTYAREVPAPAAADYYDFLDCILRTDLTASEVLRLHSRGKSYAQFLRLLNAFERSELLKARLLLD
jgi:hypothetical protein